MFGNLAEMAKLMGKAKEIQAGMKKFKEDMPHAEYSATNANGSVKVTVSGDFCIKNVEITENASTNPVILSQDFTEAANTALGMAKLAAQQKMAEMTGGLGIELPMF